MVVMVEVEKEVVKRVSFILLHMCMKMNLYPGPEIRWSILVFL